MNRTIKRFDGNQGRIIDDNGAEYFFHWTDITGGAKHKAAAVSKYVSSFNGKKSV